jgi:hypothetical protein
MMSLDEFETFVHQSRGVDRHLATHGPVGVVQRLFRRYAPDGLAGPSPRML